jgi:hypothetical protein
MSDDPISHTASMNLGTEVIAVARDPLPIIYFEEAPASSHANGIISVTLATVAPVAISEPGQVRYIAAVVGVLKCNIPAALALKAAIDNALFLAQPVENPEGPAN